uniref:Terpene synthase 10-like n=1 Tax=Cucumis melo TaxID=3656 RepID=A0A9I9DTB7_CUCME
MSLLQLPLLSPISCFASTKNNIPSSYPKFYVFSKIANSSTNYVLNGYDDFVFRRSANYQPPIWKYEFVQSLTSEFADDRCLNQRDMLIKRVKMMLNKEPLVGDSLKGLEVVDELQRLGISYHFQMEINQILEIINERFNNEEEGLEWNNNRSLYTTSLHFRILRQHGYHIPQDVFGEFKNEIENLDCICEEKAKGMLSFYEASFLAREGESFMDEARQFVTQRLSKYLKSNNNDQIICTMISHALQLPFHWRMPRLEARWFIDNVYRTKPDSNPVLLDLAKLDFNIVQSIHQNDLKDVSRWWNSTGLGEKLEFARDRLMANFFWSVGMGCEPHLQYLRTMSTKIASFITIVDDVYDVYGTLDELELFTDAVERWNIGAIDSLPNYMQICFIALHNTINDMAFDAIKDHGVNVIPYLRKMWTDLCKTFYIEAKWYYTNYKPTFEEYLENAWISVSGSLLLVHAYEEAKRGEVAKSIQCYMNDTGASEQEARRYLKDFIMESWKKLNEEVQTLNNSPLLSKSFIEIALNVARISHTVYQHRDGHTVEDHETKDRRVVIGKMSY